MTINDEPSNGEGDGNILFQEKVTAQTSSREIYTTVSLTGIELEMIISLPLVSFLLSDPWKSTSVDFKDISGVEFIDGTEIDTGVWGNIEVGKDTEPNTLYTTVNDTYNLSKHEQGIVRIERIDQPIVYISTNRPHELTTVIADQVPVLGHDGEPFDLSETDVSW